VYLQEEEEEEEEEEEKEKEDEISGSLIRETQTTRIKEKVRSPGVEHTIGILISNNQESFEEVGHISAHNITRRC
jgi:hypothetical protein